LGTVAFFDIEPTSATFGERIEHFPGCEQKSELHGLSSKAQLG
jgi:hypothetical protein